MTAQTGLRSEIRMARRKTVSASRTNVFRPLCSSVNVDGVAVVAVMLRLLRRTAPGSRRRAGTGR